MRVDLLARGRADVALLRPRVLLVDALLDLGQHAAPAGGAAPPAPAPRACPRRASGRAAAAAPARAAAAPAAAAASPATARSVCALLRSRRRFRPCADGGSGEVARPFAASPPPARLACAMACALVGASPERELTRITSSGVSWNTRLKRLRVDEAHRQQRGVHADRDEQRDLQAGQAPGTGCGAGPPLSVRSGGVDGSAAGSASRRRLAVGCRPSIVRGRWPAPVGARLGGVLVVRRRARLPSAAAGRSRRAITLGVHVERQQVDAADAHAHLGAARQALGAERAEHQRQRRRRAPGRPSSRWRRARARRSASGSAASSSARSPTGSRCRRRRPRRSPR